MLHGFNPQNSIYIENQAQARNEHDAIVTPVSEHEETQVTNRQVRVTPEQSQVGADGRNRDSFELSKEAQEIQRLQSRDREVRAHEAAHAAVGGAFAGSPTYTFERGPDGQTYAVGGEVGIDISPVAGDPQATIQKARQIRSAALAPAQPSAQDMTVAQKAQAMESNARQQLNEESSENLKSVIDGSSDPDNVLSGSAKESAENEIPEIETSAEPISSRVARLSLYA